MKNTSRTTMLFSALTAVALCAGSATAQDWPQWRGANGEAKVKNFNAPKAWPQQLSQKWKVTVGQSDSTPALVGDRLYVFTRQDTDEVTRCLSVADGKEIWSEKHTVQPPNGPSAREHSGPRSSPVVASGKVVTLGVRGTLTCFDAAKGTVVWRKEDITGWPQFFTAMSPIIVDGLCIAHLGGANNGTVIAYDLNTGADKWKWTGDGPSYGSPSVMSVGGAKLIMLLTDKNIVAINAADGKAVWQKGFAGAGMGAYNAASPIVDGQTMIYSGSGRGVTAVKIERQGDAFTATELWSNKDNSPQFNTPVLKDGMVYGLTQRGNFFCINAKTGQTAWTDAAGGRGGYGSIVDAGPVLLALTPKSQLIVIQPSEKEYNEVANIKVADKPTYGYPVASGNKVYVEDADSVTLWAVE